jgi:hypothetical protein
MTSHSPRPIPIKGEYRLFTNDIRIHKEIDLGAADKILTASFVVELPPWHFDLILDVPRTFFNKAFLPSLLDHYWPSRPTWSTSYRELKYRGHA